MKTFAYCLLTFLTFAAAIFGMSILSHAASAIHEIEAFLCFGFGGMFVGLMGVMAAVTPEKPEEESK